MDELLENLVSWICKKENNIVFIAVIVVFIIFVFFKLFYPKLLYRGDIREFLKSKYNKDFEIEFQEYDKMYVREGQNIKGIYVHKVYTKELPEVYSYVICEKLTSGDVNIYESNDDHSLDKEEQNVDHYGNNLKLYNQKLKVKEGLEYLYGDAIEFDLLSSENTIFIEVKTGLEDSIYNYFNEFSRIYNSTIDLLKETDITVRIRFIDCSRDITGNTEKLTQENISSVL